MRNEFTPAQRLIVAADFKPDGSADSARTVRDQVINLANALRGTGVCIKVNSALRFCGYGLIPELHARDLRVFADLKLYDIPETLATDGALLAQFKPDLVTVSCTSGAASLRALKAVLPDTEVLGVTVLTSIGADEAGTMFYQSIAETVESLGSTAKTAGLDGLISSAAEAATLRARFGDEFTLNTPGIRPAWCEVKGDDQNKSRVMTPGDAIRAGADRIVVGRPILQADDPRHAVMRTVSEIAAALAT